MDFAFLSLLITDAFIILYHSLLYLLNKNPKHIADVQFISNIGLLPEPYEIPLYLIVSIMLVSVIFVYFRFKIWRMKLLILPYPLKILFFIILLLAFLFAVGGYPMAGETIFIQSLVDLSASRIAVSVYSLFVIFLLFESEILGRISKKLFFGLVLAIIAVLVFEPGLPASGHDFAYFLGPMDEIIKGKTIYSQVPSVYGFLSILFFAFMAKFLQFNLFYLPLINWLLYLVQYGIIFFILYRLSKTFWLPVLGIFSILTVNYFSLYHLPGSYFQIGPMRWLPLILAVLVVYLVNNLTSKKVILAIAFLSLFNIEVGSALILSYGLTLFFILIGGRIDLKKALISGLLLGVSVISFLIIFNLLSLIFGYRLIDVSEMSNKLSQFALAGANMIPMPKRTYFWLIPFIYFASIIYCFINSNRQETKNKQILINKTSKLNLFENSEKNILLFSANLTLFASVYFVGRSHPHNLFNISLFPLFTFFLLFSLQIKNLKSPDYKFFIITAVFTFFIFYPAWQRSQALASKFKLKIEYLEKGKLFLPELEATAKQNYGRELTLINDSVREEKTVILSVDDSYLFYLSGKKNLLDENPQTAIGTVRDLNRAFREIKRSCPKKIITTCTLHNLCPPYQTINSQFIDLQSILLNKLNSICGGEYKPLKCTQKLCVEEFK